MSLNDVTPEEWDRVCKPMMMEKKEMSKVKIEMEDEQVDAIIIGELQNQINWFEWDLEQRSKGEGLAFFDNDPEKDVEYIEEYLRAFEMVLSYYDGPSPEQAQDYE